MVKAGELLLLGAAWLFLRKKVEVAAPARVPYQLPSLLPPTQEIPPIIPPEQFGFTIPPEEFAVWEAPEPTAVIGPPGYVPPGTTEPELPRGGEPAPQPQQPKVFAGLVRAAEVVYPEPERLEKMAAAQQQLEATEKEIARGVAQEAAEFLKIEPRIEEPEKLRAKYEADIAALAKGVLGFFGVQ